MTKRYLVESYDRCVGLCYKAPSPIWKFDGLAIGLFSPRFYIKSFVQFKNSENLEIIDSDSCPNFTPNILRFNS